MSERLRPWPLPPVRRMDSIGFGASMLCAVHCALLPIAASVLPALGGSILATPLLEAGMIALGAVMATLSLSVGYRSHHHRPWALAVAACGFAAIAAGQTLAPEAFESALTASGAFTVAIAHVINARLCRRSCARPAVRRHTISTGGAEIPEGPGA